ncbi:uncharacterized protein LOC114940893 [Nylanderia fulva]|uniref:uncharacterized protein LOC114940893 n=1 Tax=Nylanderia fulva TaxID=613905 RepID=UPI0010FB34E6|nr:uncharacterized protein LOC114940893 [Nylanderia fulva]
MAKRINHIVLIATMLASACVIQGASITDWVTEFTSNLNRDLNSQIQQINQEVADLTKNIQKDVAKTIQNLPRDAQGNIISDSGSSVISVTGNGTKYVTIIDGVSRIITTGYTKDGEPYIRDIVEKRIGDMLYRNETITFPKTGVSETTAWKLDLAKPGSKPEIITETKTDTKKDEK